MMNSKALIAITAVSFLALSAGASPLFGQGKSSQAPGQQKKQEKAVLGNVEKVTGNAVTLEEKTTKKMVEITTDSQTQIFGQLKKKLRLSDIKLNDMVAVLATPSAGATESGKPGKAVKVFVRQLAEASTSAQGKRHAVHGIITGINNNIITLMHQIQQDRFFSVSFNSETVVSIKGIPNATTANLELGQRIAAVGVLSSDGKLLAKRIHVIPGKAIGVMKKLPISTPSATAAISPTPTNAATPSATPTATAAATPTSTLSP